MGYGHAAFSLRQHDGVRPAGHDDVEIRVGEASLQSVDAHHQQWTFCDRLNLLQVCERDVARLALALGRNRVLEIDDDRIGAAGDAFVEFLRTVAWDEEKRAHHSARMRMKAWRRHSATSLLSWL